MTRRNRWIAGLAGTALALAVSATVFAYVGQTLATITVSGPSGTLKCNTPLTIHATLIATDSTPFTGESVDWTFSSSPSSGDTINSTPTITNSSGVATTTVTLACVVGNRTITATNGEVSAGAVLAITSAGLPRTSTVPDGSPLGNLPIATLLALFAVLAGGVIIIRRFALSPR